jgi:TonB family protein
MKAIRIPIGTRTLLAALLACSVIVPTARSDASQLFRDLVNATTIADREQICDVVDPAGVPSYAALLCNGFLLLAAREDSLAVRYLEEALREQPDLAIGCVMFADAYVERQNLDQAARWYRRARTIAPDRLDPHYGLGLIWLQRAETEGAPAYEKALESLREMTRIDASSPDGWANVGMVLAKLERYEEAERSYKKALSLAPEDPQVHHSLGSLASLRGNDEQAETSWKKALSIDPAQAAAARELAALYGRQGKIDTAVQTLQKGVEAAHVGVSAGRIRRDLGLLHLLAEQPAEAGELLEEARVLSPDARTLSTLAHLRMMQNSVLAALTHLVDAAADDSAAVAPFVQAWSEQLAPALDGYRAENAEGARVLRGIVAAVGPGAGPVGDTATHDLVGSLLPDWKLPTGTLKMTEAPSEAPYDTAPVPTYRAKAEYPDAAGGFGGTVHVKVKIDAKGTVTDAEVMSKGGNPALEWAALEAAKRWRFEPAMLRGEPVASEVTIPFRFKGDR